MLGHVLVLIFGHCLSLTLCIQCPEAVDEIYRQYKQGNCSSLMHQCNDDVNIRYYGEDAQYDLQRNRGDQPLQTFDQVTWVICFADYKVDVDHCGEYDKCKPAMDKYNCLRSHEDVDEGTK